MNRETRTDRYRHDDPADEADAEDQGPEGEEQRRSFWSSVASDTSLVIGATTLAGVGLGLLAVMGGAVALGAATEAVLVPSLLAKLAGGVAGGGLGMAKGLKQARSDGR